MRQSTIPPSDRALLLHRVSHPRTSCWSDRRAHTLYSRVPACPVSTAVAGASIVLLGIARMSIWARTHLPPRRLPSGPRAVSQGDANPRLVAPCTAREPQALTAHMAAALGLPYQASASKTMPTKRARRVTPAVSRAARIICVVLPPVSTIATDEGSSASASSAKAAATRATPSAPTRTHSTGAPPQSSCW